MLNVLVKNNNHQFLSPTAYATEETISQINFADREYVELYSGTRLSEPPLPPK